MKVVATAPEMRAARAKLTGEVAVVMTMGALHSGHETLLHTARRQADHLVATIFVNPLQFGPAEDFDRYPRTLDADLAVCAAAGVDVAFTPTPDQIYPNGTPLVTVDPGPLGGVLEGASRPGHFTGVLTVVCKLMMITGADAAFYGEKDYQQLTLIRQMVRDLDLGVRVVGVPTVRDADGLALSSRNRYLTAEQRDLALTLSQALRAGARQHTATAVREAARAVLDSAGPGLDLDYLALHGADLGVPPASGEARLLVAARVGTTRLIDNIAIALEEEH